MSSNKNKQKGNSDSFSSLLTNTGIFLPKNNAFSAYIDRQKELQKAIRSICFPLQNIARQAAISVPSFKLPDLLSNSGLSKIAERLRQLPEEAEKAVLAMGNNNWFFDDKMPLSWTWKLSGLFEENYDAAKELLMEHFRSRVDCIKESLCAEYPKRTEVLHEAFSAHEGGKYYLSIPVLLSQVDGIATDRTGLNYFQRKSNQPQCAQEVEKLIKTDLDRAFLKPFFIIFPLLKNKAERTDDFDGMNRHQIMHGESCDYGTEENSLKAISLLNYVAQAFRLNENLN